MQMANNEVLFEIGVEELPARFIDRAEAELVEKTQNWLTKERIHFDTIKSYATPRRLALHIKGIDDKQQTVVEKVRGPKLDIAKDEAGNWTKAALGFCRSQGKTPEDIFIAEIKGIPYTFVEKRIEGRKTFEVLQDFHEIITSLSFPQTMRWGSEKVRFARPIRWLVALFNETVIPFEIAHVKTANISYGHRFLGEKTVIDHPANYEKLLQEQFVIADKTKRRAIILEQMAAIEKSEQFHIQIDEKLLDEVQHLVEYPTVFFGSFDRAFLDLPNEVLITTMQEHQRYFPVFTADKKQLLPHFVSVRNGDMDHIENVVRGNEKVLRARLADARFFYNEDRAYSIDHYMEKLKRVVFQDKLGTVYDKVERVRKITEAICHKLNLSDEEIAQALRAATICKFDLVTNMVDEFPELQGIIGEIYALHYGEAEVVATAIREHYYPLQASGTLPETVIGAIVSVADKLDTVVGAISVGLTPTGSQDPYGLRRQAIGLLRIMLENNWPISLEEAVAFAEVQHDTTAHKKDLWTFLTDRVAYVLQQHNLSSDIVRAVLEQEIGVLPFTLAKALVLQEKRNDATFKVAQEAFTRILNLAQHEQTKAIDSTLFQTPSEKALYEQLLDVKDSFMNELTARNAKEAFATLEKLAEPIHSFFEHNLVMDQNEQIKQNRLALVNEIATLIKQFANLSLIEWKQHH